MNCEEIEGSIAPYALGAFTPQEQEMVEAHLAECAHCRQLLAEYRDVVGRLPYGVPLVEPPPELKGRVLGRIAALEQVRQSEVESAVGHWRFRLGRLTWTRRLAWAYLGVVAVVALAGWGSYLQVQVNDLKGANRSLEEVLDTQRAVADVLASPSMAVREFRGTEVVPEAWARLLVDPITDQAMLVVVNLTPLQPDRVYQLWLAKDAERVDGGTFTVKSDGRGYLAVRSPEPLLSYSSMGVTDEPTGGSPAPTGQGVLQLVP